MARRMAMVGMLIGGLLLTGCAASGDAGAHEAATSTSKAEGGANSSGRTVIYDPSRDAEADITAAVERATSQSKRVLIDFGADWCPDCVVLDGLYDDPKVQPYLDQHFELVTVDVGNWDHNVDISDRYDHVIDSGIPALVVLDESGKPVATTADGSFASARTMTPDELLEQLTAWAG